MNTFIILTAANGEYILVNTVNILYIRDITGGSNTAIYCNIANTKSDGPFILQVKESRATIAALIDQISKKL